MTRRENNTPSIEVVLMEMCPGCLQTYDRELGYVCADCDHPVCPFCVVRVEERILCSQCNEDRRAQ